MPKMRMKFINKKMREMYKYGYISWRIMSIIGRIKFFNSSFTSSLFINVRHCFIIFSLKWSIVNTRD